MLLALFFMLLLSPCLVACVGAELTENSLLAEWQGCRWTLPNRKRLVVKQPPLRLEEAELSDGFVLRSFPKGISQRRVVVQDTVEGARLTIAAVRLAIAKTARFVAYTVRTARQTIRETREQLLERLAAEARIALAQAVARQGRMDRQAASEYARACARLRWSEVTTEAGWSGAFASQRIAA